MLTRLLYAEKMLKEEIARREAVRRAKHLMNSYHDLAYSAGYLGEWCRDRSGLEWRRGDDDLAGWYRWKCGDFMLIEGRIERPHRPCSKGLRKISQEICITLRGRRSPALVFKGGLIVVWEPVHATLDFESEVASVETESWVVT